MARWMRVLVAIALVVAACGSDDTGAPTGSDDRQALECEREGYPCSLDEVPQQILDRSHDLSDDVLAMLERGSSGDEVHAWLESQEGMAEVDSDEQAIRFRLDGGRGTWILREAAFGTRGAPRPVPATPPNVTPGFHVAGPDSKDKRALVLSPFKFDFDPVDDGPLVASLLSSTRGYEGRVEFAANEASTDTDVTIESYKGWDKFEVVHVATHGTTICQDKEKRVGCRAAVVASVLNGAPPTGKGVSVTTKQFRDLTDRGLDLGRVEGDRGLEPEPDPNAPPPVELDIVLLTADFFGDQYKSGLDNTLVFLNACEVLGGDSDIDDVLKGQTSVVLGWNDTVSSGAAVNAAAALYRDLGERGYPVEVAFSNLEDEGLTVDPNLTKHAELIMSGRGDGDGLRIRDVVELLDPESGELLSAQDTVSIVGTQGDGEPDLIPYLVQVDGMRPEFAPDVILHVAIDGSEIDPQPITNGSVDDEDRWLVGGVAPLGFDLEEATPVGFKAWVELHEGGESDDETTATAIGDEPIMGLQWVMEVTSTVLLDTGGALESSATLTLEFEKGQAFDEPHPRYVVIGGTVRYAGRNISALGCDYSGGEQTFSVTPAMSPANPPPPTAASVLVFDTTVTPVRFHGIIYTFGGPDRIVTQTCHTEGDSITNDINYGHHVTWMFVEPGDAEPVIDRRTIEGADAPASGHTLFYTLTRVE